MTRDFRMLLAGGVITLAVLLVAVTFFVWSGAYEVAADAPHTAIVKAMVATVRERSIESRLGGVTRTNGS